MLRKAVIIAFTAVTLALASDAGELRRVTVLHFTAVSCGPCGAAAVAMERLKSEAGDSINVVGVHYYDSYAVPEAESLASYYQIVGTPTSWFDGTDVQYYADTATYWNYRNAFDKAKVLPPRAGMALWGQVDTIELVGTIVCSVSNPSAETLHSRLRLAMVERAIYRPWGGGDSVHDVLRDMLPGFDGPEIILAPGADTALGFQFQVQPGWQAGMLEFAAWAEPAGGRQAPGSGAVMQSARISLGQLTGVSTGSGLTVPAPRISASICPNPLRGKGTLAFFLPRAGQVKAAFYDISGRRIESLDLGWLPAGRQRISLDSQKWPKGAVMGLIESEGFKKVVKNIVIN